MTTKLTAKDILGQMKKALKEFGTYTFEDKGPDEVMDTLPIITAIAAMPALEARKLLETIYDHSKYGAILAGDLVVSLHTQPEEWFNVLLESPALAESF